MIVIIRTGHLTYRHKSDNEKRINFHKIDLMVFNFRLALQSGCKSIIDFTFRTIKIADLDGHFTEIVYR